MSSKQKASEQWRDDGLQAVRWQRENKSRRAHLGVVRPRAGTSTGVRGPLGFIVSQRGTATVITVAKVYGPPNFVDVVQEEVHPQAYDQWKRWSDAVRQYCDALDVALKIDPGSVLTNKIECIPAKAGEAVETASDKLVVSFEFDRADLGAAGLSLPFQDRGSALKLELEERLEKAVKDGVVSARVAAQALELGLQICKMVPAPQALNMTMSDEGDILFTLFGAGKREAELWVSPDSPDTMTCVLVDGAEIHESLMPVDRFELVAAWLSGAARPV